MLGLERRDEFGRIGQASMECRVCGCYGRQVRLGPRDIDDRSRHARDTDAVDRRKPPLVEIAGVKPTIANEIIPTVAWTREVDVRQVSPRHGLLVQHRRAHVGHDVRTAAAVGPCLHGMDLLRPIREVHPIDVHACGDPNKGTVSYETPQLAFGSGLKKHGSRIQHAPSLD